MELVSNVTQEEAKQILEQSFDKGLVMPYLILLVGDNGEGEELKEWKMVIGRQEAYDYIKFNIGWIDLEESLIVSQENTIKDAIKVFDYLVHVLESGKIEDPGFDPRDYMIGNVEDEEEEGDEE